MSFSRTPLFFGGFWPDKTVAPIQGVMAYQPFFHWALAVQGRLLCWLSAMKRMLFILLLLLGACTVYDHAIGDGVLPRLNELASIRSLKQAAQENSTAGVTTIHSQDALGHGWQALGQTRELLTALSPEIALWLVELQQNHSIAYPQASALTAMYRQADDTPVLAAYEKASGKLLIYPAFWALSDGEKVATLAHEYRHARQNWAKKISVHLGQLVAGGRLAYDSRLEAEAFDFERQARFAMGLSSLNHSLAVLPPQ